MREQSLQNFNDIPKDLIRTETVLSRFPIHRLSKSGKVSIEIKVTNAEGKLTTKWKVKNPPDPLAYKVDTLIVNRRIDELGKPVPKLIKLGSLNELADELGLKKTRNTEHIKNAIIQNIGAVINARFTYKKKDGKEKYIEIADTRYGAIFTGEELPNGDKADATYIYLHDIYREIVNTAQTRPLDYDYLKELTPMAQRFYELLSYQMYGAIKNKTNEAKMIYSEFCAYAPQTRFKKWNQVRAQMYRVHKPHLESGYIKSHSYQEFRHEDGTLDWKFVYVPGRKAKGEFSLATTKRLRQIKAHPNQLSLLPELPVPKLMPEIELAFTEEEEKLISQVRKFGVSDKKARELVKSDKEAVEREILVFPTRLIGTDIKSPAGFFIKALEDTYEPPQAFHDLKEEKKTRKRTEELLKEQRAAQKAQFAKSEAYDRARKRLYDLSEDERHELWESKRKEIMESEDFKDADEGKLKVLESVIEGMIQGELIDTFMKEEQ